MIGAISELRDRRACEIAAQLSGASSVFRRFSIEFCCQGHVSLTDAVNHRNLDLNEVEGLLEALDPTAVPQAPQETGALIEYIQTRYHDIHRRPIAELIELSCRVEITHVNHPSVPAGLAQTLQQFLDELELLMKKQEATHFPASQEWTAEELRLSIRLMRHDHNEYAFFLDRIDRLTDTYNLPEDACASWQAH